MGNPDDPAVLLIMGLIGCIIGLKLVNHALHKNEVPFINGGEHWDVIPEPSIAVSLGFIVVTIVLTVVASLLSSRPVPTRREAGAEQEPTG